MLVTIGIPFYNAEKTIVDAIKSVYAQTYKEWELILVDDGSTDRSLELIQGINDPRITVISDGSNRRLPYRLNQIAQLAKGKYLARMDADDLMYPKRIETQVSYLEAYPTVDVVSGLAVVINDWNEPTGKLIRVHGKDKLTHTQLIHPCCIGHTSWFLDNPYSEEYIRAEDHELWVRTYRHSEFAIIDEPLYLYRHTDHFNLINYLMTCATNKKIYRKYGPEIVGKWRTQEAIIKTILKENLYRLLFKLNKIHLVVGNRGVKLSPKLEGEAVIAISEVLKINFDRFNTY
jgi:glycosyltransferase involved in cell wall biosynthesis